MARPPGLPAIRRARGFTAGGWEVAASFGHEGLAWRQGRSFKNLRTALLRDSADLSSCAGHKDDGMVESVASSIADRAEELVRQMLDEWVTKQGARA